MLPEYWKGLRTGLETERPGQTLSRTAARSRPGSSVLLFLRATTSPLPQDLSAALPLSGRTLTWPHCPLTPHADLGSQVSSCPSAHLLGGTYRWSLGHKGIGAGLTVQPLQSGKTH